jgi:cytochrome c oxidase subunit 2
MRRSTTLFLALVATSSLVLAACGDNDDTSSVGTTMSDSGMGATTGGDMGHDGAVAHDEISPFADGARRIAITARSFEFDADEITVTAGEDVAIVLTSEDLLHDFTIDELDAHVAADPDETSEGGLRADEPGRYTFYCTVTGHRDAGMEGTLIVE